MSYRKIALADKAAIRRRFMTKIQVLPNGCWYWLGTKMVTGYGYLKYKGKLYRANRLSLFLFKDFDLYSLLCSLHKCDNPTCVSPEHLFAGTNRENTLDAKRKGRLGGLYAYGHEGIKGSDNTNAKLTDDQVIQIRHLYQTGPYSQRELGRMFNVHSGTIRHIVLNRTWRHLLPEAKPQPQKASVLSQGY